jgi:hypothetical protein
MKTLSLLLLSLLVIDSARAASYRPIIRSFHSVRTAGMGDVRYTTGLYEENFYANPARMTANPSNRIQLPKISVEAGSAALGALSDLLNSHGDLSAASGSVGKPISARFQLVFPGYYNNKFTSDDWAIGVGLSLSAATTAVVSQTGTIDPMTNINFGPAFTVARRLLEDDRLSVGATVHAEMRATSNSLISLQDFLAGHDLTDAVKGGSGLGLDFDLGTTFRPHWKLGGFEYELAFAINNIMNGMYKNLSTSLIEDWGGAPMPSNRSYNFGISATHQNVGPFDQVLVALEVTDLGNNPGGSVFRLIHVGSEARWKKLAVRAGINQGYLAAGFGTDLGYFSLNLATYGEEMGLNAGTMEDRRYALEFGFHI